MPSGINYDYIESDLMGEKVEAINQKNPPRNLLNDGEHFAYAKNFLVFITEDKGCYEKSKELIKHGNKETKVMYISEFNNFDLSLLI